MFQTRTLRLDGSVDDADMSMQEVINYLRALMPHLMYNGELTRLTIDAEFATIEIIPQGGLSLLTE